MPPVTLHLRLSENALTMIDKLRTQRKDPTGAEVSRERWVFQQLREVGSSWAMRWNLAQAHGQVAVDPQGQVLISLSEIPDLPVGEGTPNANIHVLVPDVVLEQVRHAYLMNAAFLVHGGTPNPWATMVPWAEKFLTDAAAINLSALEDQRAQAAADYLERQERLVAERARRLKAIAEGQPEPEPSSSGGRVASLVDTSAAGSDGGTST